MEEFQNKGIGEQFFYLTMYAISKQYRHHYIVDWMIFSTINPLSSETNQKLFKFYGRVGAKVNEYLQSGRN